MPHHAARAGDTAAAAEARTLLEKVRGEETAALRELLEAVIVTAGRLIEEHRFGETAGVIEVALVPGLPPECTDLVGRLAASRAALPGQGAAFFEEVDREAMLTLDKAILTRRVKWCRPHSCSRDLTPWV